ncbi:TPA: hypothetical protein QDB15_002368 [Burkholderia vietnamiensis]|uniref:Uncharacterized protein n=3 Tax=Burkholderia cepacia complex TaxID=87882 RepID=A0A132DVU4_BURVI|nr:MULTISPECIES: hypothetical protein [Burkholderia]AFJ89232.1 hypothetical protein MYA_4881 [Burkholderia sp. KJ006]KVR86918.1 hypothetical protein WK28_28890 [Burkholderia vietnamiensis]KVS12234.1 hypothetical protein WK32_03885 [Burkholderia vietnamiensis]MBR7908040.1 hypothetical protein [Burkholderia vietnamiensis]MBR8003650.1 hypothetical protein [Burkholderia vietnamiensis]
MKYYSGTSIDRRDDATRQKQRDDLARADVERAEKRIRQDAGINSNASKWRYSRPDNRAR